MLKLHYVLLTGVALAFASVSAQAEFVGSIGSAGLGASQNKSDLSQSTVLSTVLNVSATTGADDFFGIPLGTSFGGSTIDLAQATVGFGLSLANAQWGSFAATSGYIVLRTSHLLDLYIEGIYTSGTDNPNGPGNSAAASARVTFTQNGGSLMQQIVINAPPNPPVVPEPSSVALGAIGLVSLGLVRAFRKRSSN